MDQSTPSPLTFCTLEEIANELRARAPGGVFCVLVEAGEAANKFPAAKLKERGLVPAEVMNRVPHGREAHESYLRLVYRACQFEIAKFCDLYHELPLFLREVPGKGGGDEPS